MNPRWDVYCRDCDAHAEIPARLSVLALVQFLCMLGGAFSALRVASRANMPIAREMAELAESYAVPLAWFEEHGGHRLAPREWRDEPRECGKTVRCSSCDQETECRLAPGHEGDHAP